jgi:beta-alanine--pyruvate transaminase
VDKLSSQWLPFTANRYFKSHPKLLTGAEGMYYMDASGQSILDSSAGLWCVNAGHGQKKIKEAIQKAVASLDYAPSFQVSHPFGFELANRLTTLTPSGLNKVFYTNSGSEAVDTALKIAMHYQDIKSDGHKKRIVGREKGYHGVGFGGISVGGLPNNQKHFQLLPHVSHLPHTHDLEHNAFSKGQPKWGVHLADSLQTLHDEKGDIAAVIVEPIAGSVGVLIPPVGYLKALREICDNIGALLIFDEVITGFGRVGDAFAANHFDVTPDIITSAKGLTNGAIPMGAVFIKDEIYETILNHGKDTAIEFFHGYTYSGHPLACQAALAALDVYEELDLFSNARKLSGYWESKMHALRNHPHVIDIRNYGLMGAIELSSRENAPGARAFDIFNRCFDNGLLVRCTGDTLAFSPPLIIENHHIDTIFEMIGQILHTID